MVPYEIPISSCFNRSKGTAGLISASCQITLNEQLHPDLLSMSVNQGQYPRLYYRVMGIFASENVVRSVITMRLANSLLAAVLLGLALLTAEPRRRIGLLKSWLLLIFPLAAFVIASINNSSWSVLGVGTFWVFLAEVMSGGRAWRRALAALGMSVAVIIALGSRPESAYFLAASTVAILIVRIKRDILIQRVRSSVALKVFLPLLVLFIAIYFGHRIRQSVNAYKQINPEIFNTTLLLNNLVDVPMYIAGAFGSWGRPDWPFGLGWFDIAVPQVVPLTLILVGAHFFYSNLSAISQKTKVVSAGLTVGLFLIVLAYCQRVGYRTDFFLQPRYLLPILFPIAGIALSVDFGQRVHRYRVMTVALAISSVGVISLYAVIARFVSNADISVSPIASLSVDQRQWWWETSLSPMSLLILGSVLTVLFVSMSMSQIVSTSRVLRQID